MDCKCKKHNFGNAIYAFKKSTNGKNTTIYRIDMSGNLSWKEGMVLDDKNGDYHNIDTIVVTNISTRYVHSKSLEFTIGIENLTDADYSYDLGYPEAGREYYAKATYNF